MELSNAIETVRDYVTSWSTQKLCGVLAFCEDGKMQFNNSCCCLLGVASSTNLHQNCFSDGYLPGLFEVMDMHYMQEKILPGAETAERAYLWMGYYMPDGRRAMNTLDLQGNQKYRDHHFAAMILDLLAEREPESEVAVDEAIAPVVNCYR